MKRVLALWLPNWPVQRVTLARPEWAGRGLVLHGPSRRGESVVACSAAAQRAGVEAGMPLAEAVAMLGKERFEPHDPAADRTALVALAQWCHQFSPSVGLEDAEAPEALLLDATNLAPLYGSEESLAGQVARALRRRGLDARLALADTVSAALGLARFGELNCCHPEGRGDRPQADLLGSAENFKAREIETNAAPKQAATRRRSIARGASPWSTAPAKDRSPHGAMVSEHQASAHETDPPSPLRGSEIMEASGSRGWRPWLLTDGPVGLGGSRGATTQRESKAALKGEHDSSADLRMTECDAARGSRLDEPAVARSTALPLAALRLPEELLDTLAHLGLACVGDVLALPREQLRSRFGPLLVERINQFTVAAPEVILAVDPPEEFVAGEAFEHPLTQGEAIRIVIARLLERLGWLLATRRAGALAVTCRIECEGAPHAEFQFGLFRATACARHLAEIAELQLEHVRLGGPAEAIEVRAPRHAPLVERQGALFDESRSLDGSRQLAALVDRLAGRLGRGAVVGVKLVRDAQPELAYRTESLVDGPGARRRRSERASVKTRARRGKSKEKEAKIAGRESEPASGALERPPCLLARPMAVEMASVVPEGPPIYFRHRGRRYDVARHWGPERIETGWWRRDRAVRDYYRVETSEGRRFWLFRRRDGRWFLSGKW